MLLSNVAHDLPASDVSGRSGLLSARDRTPHVHCVACSKFCGERHF